ncbi:Trm112 family protein [Geobacter sp.]|uniref:Trm112 family protein n=1 Tax=Geobacter sp. TaxID=46610 RepID=UPI001ACC04E0|nr:hypothetical protein BROC_01861 [Candidatus Brocadiaceae bacterium]
MPDLIEDFFAFLYSTKDRKNPTANNGANCPACGAELEYDEENETMTCPNCD